MLKSATIAILSFFLMDAIGSICFLLVNWYEVQHDMELMVHSSGFQHKLTSLHLTSEEAKRIHWLEQDEEFIFEGVLYDVESIRHHHAGEITIRCLIDQKEATVYNEIREIFDLNSPLSREHHAFILHFFKFLSTLVFQPLIPWSSTPDFTQQEQPAFVNTYQLTLPSFLFQPPDPISF